LSARCLDARGLWDRVAAEGSAGVVGEVDLGRDDDARARSEAEVACLPGERDEREEGDGGGGREDAAGDVSGACRAAAKDEADGEEERGARGGEAPGLLGGEADDQAIERWADIYGVLRAAGAAPGDLGADEIKRAFGVCVVGAHQERFLEGGGGAAKIARAVGAGADAHDVREAAVVARVRVREARVGEGFEEVDGGAVLAL
jgi:hypothetical protein